MPASGFSDSIFGLHIHSGAAVGLLETLRDRQALPKFVKLIGADQSRVQDVHRVHPGIKVVMRRMDDEGAYWRSGEPGGAAWIREIADRLDGVWGMEFLNERSEFLNPALCRAQDAAAFGFVMACRSLGIVPIIHGWSVGCPDFGMMAHFVRSVQACCETVIAGKGRGMINYHAYHPLRWDYRSELYALRFREFEVHLRRAGVTAPIIWFLGEAGWDRIESAPEVPSGAWKTLVDQGHLSIEDVQQSIRSFGARLQSESVIAAMLYDFYALDEDDPFDYGRGHYVMNHDNSPGAMMRFWPEYFANPSGDPGPAPDPDPVEVIAWPAEPYTAANLRRGPGKTFAIAGETERGTRLGVTGSEIRPDGKWLKVETWIKESVTRPAAAAILAAGAPAAGPAKAPSAPAAFDEAESRRDPST